MPIYTLTSASGSPGVTTSALALALGWPRPVTLVEADPTGGSSILAGFFKGTVDHPGLLQLMVAHRQGQLAPTLPSVLLPLEGSPAKLLAGTRSHDQALGVDGLWTPLLAVLRDLVATTGQDVIVDAGRLGLDGCPLPLITGGDVTALVVGSSLPEVAAARSWATSLHERAAGALGVLVVGEGRPYSAKEVANALGLDLLGVVPFDPAHAAVYSRGADHPEAKGIARWARPGSPAERHARSAFARALTAVAETLRTRAGEQTGAAMVEQDEERVR